MVMSAGSKGPPTTRFEIAPPNVIVFFFAAAEASRSASSSGLRGTTGADRNGARAGFSGKPLLYAVPPHCAKSMGVPGKRRDEQSFNHCGHTCRPKAHHLTPPMPTDWLALSARQL